MSDKCPKCDANRTQFEGQTSWECGSYQSLLGGSHIHRPQFKLIEGEHCKARQEITALRTELAAAKQRVAELEDELSTLDAAIPVTPAHAKADAAALDKLRSLHGAPNSNFTPLDRITHIPGKEDHDGGIH